MVDNRLTNINLMFFLNIYKFASLCHQKSQHCDVDKVVKISNIYRGVVCGIINDDEVNLIDIILYMTFNHFLKKNYYLQNE